MKAKKWVAIIQILGLAVLNAFLLLYYFYLNRSRNDDFWRLSLGGIGVAESREIICVIIFILPDFLFCHYICNRYIRQLKENYVYVFVREKNMKKWLRKFIAISLFCILLYKIETLVILYFMGGFLQIRTAIQVSRLIVLILCQSVKLANILIFCDLLLLKFNETVSVYANLLIQAFPLFTVGVFYDMGGPWKMAVKYIPVNWCNYNYLTEAGINPWIMFCLSVMLGCILYFCSEQIFKDYETI